jgi:hypothetical protein
MIAGSMNKPQVLPLRTTHGAFSTIPSGRTASGTFSVSRNLPHVVLSRSPSVNFKAPAHQAPHSLPPRDPIHHGRSVRRKLVSLAAALGRKR